MDEPVILDEAQRKAVHLQRDAAQAVEVARKVQIQEVADKVTEFIPDERQMARIIREEVENVLAKGTEQEKAMILARVPYICQDIKDIHNTLSEIKDLLSTYPIIKILVFGFVGMVLVAVVTALLALVVMN